MIWIFFDVQLCIHDPSLRPLDRVQTEAIRGRCRMYIRHPVFAERPRIESGTR